MNTITKTLFFYFFYSEGFGGPACGLACLQQNAVDESNRIKLDRKSQDAVCLTLCENGLGKFNYESILQIAKPIIFYPSCRLK